jgi:hypothetical protein
MNVDAFWLSLGCGKFLRFSCWKGEVTSEKAESESTTDLRRWDSDTGPKNELGVTSKVLNPEPVTPTHPGLRGSVAQLSDTPQNSGDVWLIPASQHSDKTYARINVF